MTESQFTRDDPRDLEREVSESRRQVQSDLHALDRKLSKDNIKHELRENLNEKVHQVRTEAERATRRFGHGAGASIRNNPVPALLIGAGVGYFIYDAYSRSKASHYHSDPLQRGWSKAKRSAEGWVEGAERWSEKARGQASEAGDSIAHAAHEGAEHVAEWTHSAAEQTRNFYEENPLTCAGIALAAGVGIAMTLPSTRREDELVGPYRDELLERARSEAMRARGVAEDAASGALQAAEDDARARGLDPQSLKEKAEELGQDAKAAALAGSREARQRAEAAYASRSSSAGRG